MSKDSVGVWHVPLSSGLHSVEFEHGTATGRRVIKVDNDVVFQKEWMFRLVGDQEFNIGTTPCLIRIEPIAGFSYQYSLLVDGKPLSEFTKQRSTSVCTWVVQPDHRIVLEKETLDIWVDGEKVEATGEFVEDGTETHFTIEETPAYIRVSSSNERKTGLLYDLVYKDQVVPQDNEVYE